MLALRAEGDGLAGDLKKGRRGVTVADGTAQARQGSA
jgi:hypothetical protein